MAFPTARRDLGLFRVHSLQYTRPQFSFELTSSQSSAGATLCLVSNDLSFSSVQCSGMEKHRGE